MHLARFWVVIVALFLVTAITKGDVIYNITFTPKSMAALQFNQNVDITFDYRTSQAGGVRIFARPMTGGSLSANYSAHPSPVYPLGAGSGSGYFSITSGMVTVDAVRFQVFDANQTTLLLEFSVPVTYIYSAHAIYDIALTPATPSSIQFNQDVSVAFKYRTTESGGVRIFPRPMTGSSTTPNYAASPSALYPTGSGIGSGWFTITTGQVKVDGIRFEVYNDAQTSLLLEMVIPVDYDYAAHSISNIQCTPAAPQGRLLGEDVTITFDYRTTQAGGVLIFPRPFTQGALSPNYGASGSPTYPTGSGSGTGSFSILAGEVTVDSVRFLMTTVDQSQVLLEYFVPVNYHCAAHKIADVRFSPSSPAYFTLSERDSSFFNYTTTQPGGVVIFPRPITQGALTPGYAASPSPIFPTGSGSGSGGFQIDAGGAVVDHMRFAMRDSTQTQTLVQWFYPVLFQYGNMTMVGVSESGSSIPASFALAQNYPNPFNPSTTIKYELPKSSEVRLSVYDMLGREVSVLINEGRKAGVHELKFDARGLSSGVYFYRFQAGDFVATKRLLLLK